MQIWLAKTLCTLFAIGCTATAPSVEVPVQIFLFDSQKNPVAVATPLTESILISAEVGDIPLLWHEEPLELAAKFLEQYTLFFYAPERLSPPPFSLQPPAVGESLFLLSGGRPVSTSVLRTEDARFFVPQETDVLPGTPLFDDEGVVHGVVIGADPFSQELSVVRIDRLQKFLRENQE
ncbi:MAG: hypothetical protein K9M51_03150 [Candidatus Gracilibacteria bacterium]|nr:hypothetical protein [Candidatus Gracilibacteria bacterium]